ncbi:hypothetical protein [Glaciibacter psychrotolerans]|uniref:Uncharacterized protein n=1 Tax=Glaciibacter psychrotolerans TaxID=670054 RepID=A0A7Z0J7Y3_9MICO|nr:hypothetical protein [Leifsonia psychrotolerans]NYJ21458.1 hypothetical protein [Leifsonia psychrotolerans]
MTTTLQAATTEPTSTTPPASAQPATPPQTPAAPTSASAAPVDAQSDATDARRRGPAAEAAARRHQLRDAEATISTQAAQIAAMQRDAIENLIALPEVDLRGDGSHAATLQRAADLWEVLKAEPGQFFDETGALDRIALADFIAMSTEGRDYLTRSNVEVPPSNPAKEALDRQRSSSPRPAAASPWSAAFR